MPLRGILPHDASLVPLAIFPDPQHGREIRGSARRHDDVAVLGDVRDGQGAPGPHGFESVLAFGGVGLAAGAGVGEVEDVFGADEDAVVGFVVAAGEAVEVDLGEGGVHGARRSSD